MSGSGSEGADSAEPGHVQILVDRIVSSGIDGIGPLQGARQLADEHLRQHKDAEKAIPKYINTHTRLVAATGFATGLGGFIVLPVTVPTDMAVLYAMSARCAAGVAHLRGYDVTSDEVRSVVLLSLLGSAGAGLAAEAGVQIGNKAALAALKKLPGKYLTQINQKVGFRLVAKFGEKGVINLGKLVPAVGAPIGAASNVATMRTVGRYAKSNFPS